MPVKRLPSKLSLDHLKHQARDLLKAHAAAEIGALQRLREFHPRFRHASDPEIAASPLKLSDAQLAIARESGFPGWPRLKAHIESPSPASQLSLPHHQRIQDPVFGRAVDLLDSGDVPGLHSHLQQHPGLAANTSSSKAATTSATQPCSNSSPKTLSAAAPSRQTSSTSPKPSSSRAPLQE